jgi:hypothetical protein
MKYPKKIEDWRNRYDFLEDGPEFFVCYFPNGIVDGDGNPKYDGEPYIWYHDKGGTDTIDGYKYVFYNINGVKTSNTQYTIQLDKPLVASVNLSYIFTGSVNGVGITTGSTRYVESGVTSFTLTIPTIAHTSSGQQITIAGDFQIEDLDINIQQTDYNQGVIIFTK